MPTVSDLERWKRTYIDPGADEVRRRNADTAYEFWRRYMVGAAQDVAVMHLLSLIETQYLRGLRDGMAAEVLAESTKRRPKAK